MLGTALTKAVPKAEEGGEKKEVKKEATRKSGGIDLVKSDSEGDDEDWMTGQLKFVRHHEVWELWVPVLP